MTAAHGTSNVERHLVFQPITAVTVRPRPPARGDRPSFRSAWERTQAGAKGATSEHTARAQLTIGSMLEICRLEPDDALTHYPIGQKRDDSEHFI